MAAGIDENILADSNVPAEIGIERRKETERLWYLIAEQFDSNPRTSSGV